MTFRISPGVYPNLEDLSQRVPNFPSSIGAICFASLRGPTRIRAITNIVQFTELYGEPTPGNNVVPGKGHDTAGLFLEEANLLYCLRATHPNDRYAIGALVSNGGSGYTGSSVRLTLTAPPTAAGSRRAEAVASISKGRVSFVNITDPGAGYTTPPTVTIPNPPSGVAAQAVAVIENGRVTGIQLVEFLQPSSTVDIAVDYEEVATSDLASLFATGDHQTIIAYVMAENPGTWANSVGLAINQVNLGVTKQATITFDGPLITNQGIQYNHAGEVRTVPWNTNSDATISGLAGDIARATGGQAVVTTVADNTGPVPSSPTIAASGTNYLIGNIITVAAPAGGTDATFRVTSVSSGAVDGLTQVTPGSGFEVGTVTAVATTPANGVDPDGSANASAGTGLTLTFTVAAPENNDQIIVVTGTSSLDEIDISDFIVTGTGARPNIDLTIDRNNIPTDQSFNLQVFEGTSGRPVEEWPITLFNRVDGFGVQTEIGYQVNEGPRRSDRIRVVTTDDTQDIMVSNTISRQNLTGGVNGNAPDTQAIVQGWTQFENTQEVSVRLLMSAGYTDAAILQKITNVARLRRDAFAILDLPSGMQRATQAADFRNNNLNINDAYAAMYGPDIEIFDEATGRRRFVPPSGAVGAAYAYTARTREVWFAPAGLSRGLVRRALGLRFNYDEGDRDILAQAQINPIIRQGPSIAIWGEYTLQVAPSALQSVPVRLMMTAIEVAIADSLNSNVFDPNDPQTRFNIRTKVEDFLLPIRRGRGIEEFLVVCDETNNPPEIRDQRILNVDVYVKPVLAALYLRLTSILTRSSASFNELIAQTPA